LILQMATPDYHTAAWLKKYGWEEGKGLGKNLEGRADYVRVTKKDDTLGLGKGCYDLLDFAHWDNIYMTASKNLHINEGTEGLTITKSAPIKKSVYEGRFVTSTKNDTLVSESDESNLFNRCGNSSLRIFSQEGKMKRLVDCELKDGQYDAFEDYFTPEQKAELSAVSLVAKKRKGEELSGRSKKRRHREKSERKKHDKKASKQESDLQKSGDKTKKDRRIRGDGKSSKKKELKRNGQDCEN